MRRVDRFGPREVAALGRRGLYRMAFSAEAHLENIEQLLTKYADRPVSFADACLIRCAEVHEEARIFTFDSDFAIYRWGRNKRFHVL